MICFCFRHRRDEIDEEEEADDTVAFGGNELAADRRVPIRQERQEEPDNGYFEDKEDRITFGDTISPSMIMIMMCFR